MVSFLSCTNFILENDLLQPNRTNNYCYWVFSQSLLASTPYWKLIYPGTQFPSDGFPASAISCSPSPMKQRTENNPIVYAAVIGNYRFPIKLHRQQTSAKHLLVAHLEM